MSSTSAPAGSTRSRPAYLGSWALLPELSLYAAGVAPASGMYRILPGEHGALQLEVTWRMPGEERERTTTFGGRPDGNPIALPGGGAPGPDAFTLTHVDAQTLESAALRAGEVVAWAKRVVSADGTLLAVVQEALTPAGERVRNFQVYRRVVDAPPVAR